MKTLRTGVVGTGALGRHHTRILTHLDGSQLVGIYDSNPETSSAVSEEFGARVFPDVASLAAEVEAVVVAAPTIHHAELGCQLLEAGVHVLIEKPIAASLEEADQLLAAAGDRVLSVGHVEFFNPAVQALLAVGETPRFVEIDRLSVFSPRSLDIDVVLDLMIHDIQILHALDASAIEEVRAMGIEVLSPRIDIADVRLEFGSGCVANVTASRVSAERVRQLRAFYSERYYSLDYQHQSLSGARLESAPQEALGRAIVPETFEIEPQEPLRAELECFLATCGGEDVAAVDGHAARRALATALDIVEAIKN